MNRYVPYISLESYGVDATEFYKQFNMTMADACRATKISRKSASRVSIERASKENTEKIVLYLEEVSVNDYECEVQQSKRDIVNALKRVEEAWQDYEKKEKILDGYRCKHNIPRKKIRAKKVSLWEVLRCVKDL